MGDTYFDHKSLLKYTRLTRGQDCEEAMSMIDLVLVKKDVAFCAGCEDIREMGRDLSVHVVLNKVRLMSAWVKRRGLVNGARMTRNKTSRKHQNIEGYPRLLESEKIQWDIDRND